MTKKYPTIFKRTNGGKIQEWFLEQKDGTFRSTSGQQGGKRVVSEWTKCEEKNVGRANATTLTEQCTAEIESKYRHKLARGYVESLEERTGFREPMLAKDFKKYKNEVDFPCFTQMKLDGQRCVISRFGAFSRQGKQIGTIPHILAALQPLFAKNPEFIFDGELYADKFANDFNALISIVKKQKPTTNDLQISADNIQYWIYDFPSYIGNFSSRYNELKRVLSKVKNNCIHIVETYQVSNVNDVDLFLGQFIDAGYEGAIIRQNNSNYEWKRSKSLLKYKNFIDEEFTIVGIEEGIGNRSGTAGRMLFKAANGKDFAASVAGPREYVTRVLKEKDSLIGKQATVKYFQLSVYGVPRFPVVKAIRDYE